MQDQLSFARRRRAAGSTRRRAVGSLLALAACAIALPGPASAARVDELQSKVAAARAQATSLAAELRSSQAELFAAQQRAAAAAAREQQLTSLLAVGEERAAQLRDSVRRTERRLEIERARLARARHVLAERLVAIYESGTVDATELILSADGFDDLLTRTDYLRQVTDTDAVLAARVRQVRNAVHGELERVTALKARVDAYNARLDAARAQISAVRVEASSSAAQLAAVSASRQAAIGTLNASIGGWVGDIEAARAAAAERAREEAARAAGAESAASAETEVGKWLGGPYSIPSYIVACESGGNYGAVNPSSGAGGAYQILPSTWALYGGKGNPEDASKAEQDRIAAQIWADSGSGAWVCAG